MATTMTSSNGPTPPVDPLDDSNPTSTKTGEASTSPVSTPPTVVDPTVESPAQAAMSSQLQRTSSIGFVSQINLFLEKKFYALGLFVGKHPIFLLIGVILFFIIMMIGIGQGKVDTEILKLFTEKNSRILKEIDWQEETWSLTQPPDSPVPKGPDVLIVIYTPGFPGKEINVQNVPHMDKIHNLQLLSKQPVLTKYGVNFTIKHYCYRIYLPMNIPPIFGDNLTHLVASPCISLSPVQCFKEGIDLDISTPIQGALFSAPYLGKPSYNDPSVNWIVPLFNGQCFTWNPFVSVVPPQIVGYKIKVENKITTTELFSLRYVSLVNSPYMQAQLLAGCNWTFTQAQIDSIYGFSAGNDFRPSQCYKRFPSKDDVKKAEELVFDWEDVFIKKLENNEITTDSDDRVDLLFPSSFSNLAKEAAKQNGGLMALGVILMIVFAILAFSQYSLWGSRTLSGLIGLILIMLAIGATFGILGYANIGWSPSIIQVLPLLGLGLGADDMFIVGMACTVVKDKKPELILADVYRRAGTSVTLTTVTNFVAFAVAISFPLPELSRFGLGAMLIVTFNYIAVLIGYGSVLALDLRRQQNARADCLPCFNAAPEFETSQSTDSKDSWRYWIGSVVGTYLMHPVSKVIVLIIFSVLFIVGIIGSTKIGLGLEVADSIPESHHATHFLRVVNKWYPTNQPYIYLGFGLIDGKMGAHPFTYHDHLVDIMQLQDKMNNVTYIAKGPSAISKTSWVSIFYGWMRINYPQETDQFGVKSHQIFIQRLFEFFNTDGGSFASNIAFNKDRTQIIGSRIKMNIVMPSFTTTRWTDIIIDTRKVCNNYKVRGDPLPCYPTSIYYRLYEQYVHVPGYLRTNLLITSFVVGIISFIFLLHPGTSLLVVLVIAMIIIEVIGFSYYSGIFMNGFLALNLITAVGISVEFVAHMAREFMVTKGMKHERVIDTLGQMLFPVVCGALSTILAVFPVAFSEFPHFRIYYFNVYMLIIGFGLANGIFFLPVVLSLVGPNAIEGMNDDAENKNKDVEMYPVDKRDRVTSTSGNASDLR